MAADVSTHGATRAQDGASPGDREPELIPLWHGWRPVVAFLALYAVAVLAGLHWIVRTRDLEAFVPATGLAVGALLSIERRLWAPLLAGTSIILGALELLSGRHSAETAIALAALKTLEPLLVVVCIRRWRGDAVRLERPGDVVVLGITSLAVSALVDVPLAAAIVGFGDQSHDSAPTVWLLAVLADVVGLMTGAALVVAMRIGVVQRDGHSWLRLGAVLIAYATATAVVFANGGDTLTALPYLPLALALLIASTAGPPGGSAALFALTLIAARATDLDTGLFAAGERDPVDEMVGVQLYLLISTVTVLYAAAVHSQWRGLRTGLEAEVGRRSRLLDASERRYQRLLERSPDIIYRYRLHPLQLDYVSPAVERVLGVPPDELHRDRDLARRLSVPEDRTRLDALLAGSDAADDAPIQVRYHRPDGRLVWLEHRVTIVRDVTTGRPAALEGSARDITGLKEAEAALTHRAMHDPLTGIPNRTLFFEHVERAIADFERHGTPFAVLFFDVDHFKSVNDTHGHGAGDRVLAALARRTAERLRATDVVARIGGDEFAVLALHPDLPDGPMELAERILAAMREPVELGDRPLRVSVSIGIAVGGNRPGETPGNLLRQADVALYEAKALGRDRAVVFTEDLEARVGGGEGRAADR